MTSLPVDTANRSAAYPMRRWVFEDAAGRFDIDLGDSNVQCGTLAGLKVHDGLVLDYGHDRGTERLREMVARLYSGELNSTLITHGAQEALYLVYSALLRPGDQVITFSPGWQQHAEAPSSLGADVDVIGLRPDLTVDVEAAAAIAGPKLRLIVASTPCNPTGQRINAADLDALVSLAQRHDGYLLLDEEYSVDLSTSLATRSDRVLSVSSLSKVYGLPGLRIGWLFGTPDLVSACIERKHLTTISNSVLCESLAVEVLQQRAQYIEEYRRLTSGGLALLREWADRHSDAIQLVPPHGTPFAWIQLMTGEPPMAFAQRALDLGVMVMPGETVGSGNGFRLCFAREPQSLTEGLRRIESVLRPPKVFTSG
ncbi:aminotransferase class I/II-fold pyridoxal phosphate-dependent enzyme [Streptomyces sp. Edi2]|uniref:aminotransferase class I/II-fold pyridoxal phosphate-dependent enzyme n=1 Tax=Streptomyces sp. Edi2 TaxID=3162528 RepID=UPI003305BCEB